MILNIIKHADMCTVKYVSFKNTDVEDPDSWRKLNQLKKRPIKS